MAAEETRRIVPRGDLQGSLGSGEKRWEKAYVGNVGNVYNTVADMVADLELMENSSVITKGYHVVGDDGYGIYHIRDKVVSDVDDGGSIIFLDNGNVAELITDSTVNVKQFGAKGDGVTDDTDALIKCFESKYSNIVFPPGTYNTKGVMCKFGNKTIYGYGATLFNINNAPPNMNDYGVLGNFYPADLDGTDVAFENGYIEIYGLTIDGNHDAYPLDPDTKIPVYTTTAFMGEGIYLLHCERVVVRDCTIKNTINGGLVTYACNNVTVEDSDFLDISLEWNIQGGTAYIWDSIACNSVTRSYPKTPINCERTIVKNCRFTNSKGGCASSQAQYVEISECYFENPMGSGYEDSTGGNDNITLVRNIHDNIYNKLNQGIYHMSNNVESNSKMDINIYNNIVYDFGGATKRTYYPTGNTMKNELVYVINNQNNNNALIDISILNNTIMNSVTSPTYHVGNVVTVACNNGVCRIEDNTLNLQSDFFNVQPFNITKINKLLINRNDIVIDGTLTFHVIIGNANESLEFSENVIKADINFLGQVINATGSDTTDYKIVGNRVETNGMGGTLIGVSGGAKNSFIVTDNVFDGMAELIQILSASLTAASGLVINNFYGTNLTKTYSLTITKGTNTPNYHN